MTQQHFLRAKKAIALQSSPTPRLDQEEDYYYKPVEPYYEETMYQQASVLLHPATDSINTLEDIPLSNSQRCNGSV
jgi:hypothetical protein